MLFRRAPEWLTLLLLFSAVRQLDAQSGPTRMIGTVTDAASGLPIPHVEVEIGERVIEGGSGGMSRLHSLDESRRVGSVLTDAAGRYEFLTADIRRPAFMHVTVRAVGYLEQINMMVPVKPGLTAAAGFQLIPVEPSARQVEIINARHAVLKTETLLADPGLGQQVEPELADGSSDARSLRRMVTYNVPQQVPVTNLLGFTGMIDLDELIAGTVSAEEGDGFPYEALKTQAVCARTFALDRLNRRGHANGGQAFTSTIGSKSRTATLNTSRIVLLYNNNVIPAYFSARCDGDFTLNSEEGPTLSNCQVGGLGGGTVAWARSRPCSGHIDCSQTSEPCCMVVVRGATNHIYGHGVGMCQRGSQQFAGRDGWDWSRMLTNYYTGIAIANRPGLTNQTRVTATTTLNVRATPCGGLLSSVPQGTPGMILAGPQRPVCSLAAPNSYLTWWEVYYANGVRGWTAEDFLRINTNSFTVPVQLSVERAGGALQLSWTTNAPPLRLQSTPALGAPGVWVAETNAPAMANGNWVVTLTTPVAPRYFRLATD